MFLEGLHTETQHSTVRSLHLNLPGNSNIMIINHLYTYHRKIVMKFRMP
jgi:hypothetical protein